MADLLKWCLNNVEYQLVLKGIRRYRVQKYFILKKTLIMDRVLFAFEAQCWNSVSGNGCTENTIVCSNTTLSYIFEPFPITSYIHRQCICLRSDTYDILMHVAYFYSELCKFILQVHASKLLMQTHAIWVYALITKAKFNIQLHCKHSFFIWKQLWLLAITKNLSKILMT